MIAPELGVREYGLVCHVRTRTVTVFPTRASRLNTDPVASARGVMLTPLPNLFLLCSHARMIELSPATVSAAIRSAPAFARLGLSMRDANTRERAADTLAVAIVERLERPVPSTDPNQMPLPL